MKTILKIEIDRLSLPLTVPYKLAFGPVTAFDTVLVRMTASDGATGFGEATILTGYTTETIDGCWQTMAGLATDMAGASFEAAKVRAMADHHETPFAVTAMVSAVEMMEGHPALHLEEPADVPLLAILNATEEADIEREVAAHATAGYKTIKVKIGWDVETDLARVAFIQSCLPDGVQIRIDGNQGYAKDDGVAFASRVSPEKVELLEQPCHMDDWDAAAAVARVSNVPFMLDESIYGEAEIERAAEMGGVAYIKLKLMKAGSIANLMEQLGMIRSFGMTPVLGNGVAADPGCWMEACVARLMIDNAGEMNGFLKPRRPLFSVPLAVADGAVRLPAAWPSLGDFSAFVQESFTATAP